MEVLNAALRDGARSNSDIDRAVSPDSEIEFRERHWSEDSIIFDKGEEEDNHDMAHERRLQLLELAVLGMSDKFDYVLSPLASRQRDDARSHGEGAACARAVTPAVPAVNPCPTPGCCHSTTGGLCFAAAT